MELSQAKFAQKIEFSQGAIRDVELGKCGVSDRLILAMNKYLGVNEEWLRTGNGSMYAQTDKKDAVEQALNILMAKYNMDKFEIAMMKNYLEMSPEAKQGFKTFLKEELVEAEKKRQEFIKHLECKLCSFIANSPDDFLCHVKSKVHMDEMKLLEEEEM